MYWVNGQDEIHVASLDGTQRRLFLRVNGSRFDGMVIDVRRDRFSAITTTTTTTTMTTTTILLLLLLLLPPPPPPPQSQFYVFNVLRTKGA